MLAEKIYILDESDLYKIIGIDENTDTEAINKTYRGLAKQFHPDILRLNDQKESEQAKAIFSKITSAYNILKDPDKRKSYDYERRLKKEYEKTMNFNSGFQFNSTSKVNTTKPNDKKPDDGMSVRINGDKTGTTQEERDKATQELKNAQTDNLFNLSMEKFGKGDIDGAILELQTAVTINPKVAKYHSCLGLMMKEKGWDGYALSHFKKALSIDPKDKLALKHMATTPPVEEKTQQTKNVQKEKSKKPSSFWQILVKILPFLKKK